MGLHFVISHFLFVPEIVPYFLKSSAIHLSAICYILPFFSVVCGGVGREVGRG